MSGNSSSIFDGYFQGTVEESRARLPEQVVDDAIKAMSLDPERAAENGHHGTLKEWVWDWLASLIASYGGPGPTEIETTPKMLQKKAQADAKKLREAADVLRNLTYESLYSSNGTQSSAAISHSLRRASLPKEGPRAFHGQHAAKYHHERFGVWPVLYPFDRQLDDAITSLEQMISYHGTFLKEVAPQVRGRGEQKEGKERFDTLIARLCEMYEQLTNKPAISFPREDSTATGGIIPFLQAVLPSAQYKGEITDWALQQKVMRMRNTSKS